MSKNLSGKPPAPAGSARRDPRSLAQEAYDHIKRMILAGKFREGEKIPEEGIAQLLDMSRTPIREAIRRLKQYGLVEIKPRSYAKVAGVAPREAEQVARIRCELEKLAARSFLRIATRDDVAALGGIARRMIERYLAGSTADAFELDSEFHLEMVRRGDNKVLYDILERLDAKSQLIRVRSTAERPPEEVERHFREHIDLVERLAARDEEGLMAVLESNIIP